MKDFTITIEDLVSQYFKIQAESKEEAIEKAIEMYQMGELVLAPGDVEAKRIHADSSDEWMEF